MNSLYQQKHRAVSFIHLQKLNKSSAGAFTFFKVEIFKINMKYFLRKSMRLSSKCTQCGSCADVSGYECIMRRSFRSFHSCRTSADNVQTYVTSFDICDYFDQWVQSHHRITIFTRICSSKESPHEQLMSGWNTPRTRDSCVMKEVRLWGGLPLWSWRSGPLVKEGNGKKWDSLGKKRSG